MCVSCVSLFVLSVLPVFQLLLLRLYVLLFFTTTTAAAVVVHFVQPDFFVHGSSGDGADVSSIASTHTYTRTHTQASLKTIQRIH